MTDLKDPEAEIKKAMARGDFDNLSGKGKPLDLESYFKTPEHLRLAFHILKDAGFVPPEIKLKKEIELLKQKRDATDDEDEKSRLNREIVQKTAMYAMAIEQLRTAGNIK
jgi:hypothetical protein